MANRIKTLKQILLILAALYKIIKALVSAFDGNNPENNIENAPGIGAKNTAKK